MKPTAAQSATLARTRTRFGARQRRLSSHYSRSVISQFTEYLDGEKATHHIVQALGELLYQTIPSVAATHTRPYKGRLTDAILGYQNEVAGRVEHGDPDIVYVEGDTDLDVLPRLVVMAREHRRAPTPNSPERSPNDTAG